MIKRVKFLLFFCLMFTIGFINVNAAGHADTNTYFSSGRANGELITESDKVKVDSVIPNEYSFVLGDNYTSTIPKGIKGIDKEELDRMHINEAYSKYIAKASDIEKGKFSNTYVNAGTYKGKKVDVKLTVMDFETLDGSFDQDNNASISYIAFYNEKNLPPNELKPLGIFTEGMSWVELKYEFFESGTNSPINVKGRTAYWELSDWQGIHFLDNNTGLYGSNDSKLYYSTIDSKPFVHCNDSASSHGLYDSRYSVAETFEGTSMTRVYSFIFSFIDDNNNEIDVANGAVIHSSVVPYGLKSYARDTASGADGSKVKIGDKIKYQIQLVNDVSKASGGFPVSNKNIKDYSTVLLNDEKDDSRLSIVDNLSKGLKYVEGSSKLVVGDCFRENGFPIGNPKISVTDDATVLEWNDIPLSEGNAAILTYEVEVTNDASSKVSNSASAMITNDCSKDSSDPHLSANIIDSLAAANNTCIAEKKITLNKLVNPLVKEKDEKPTPTPEKKPTSDKIINVPDTGSVIALSSIIGGFALIISGSYMLYREYGSKKK